MPEKQAVDPWALSDLCTPWSLHVVVTLRVAENIAGGADRIDELAAATHSDAYVLHRVMEHLVGKGVFEQPEPGRFALNDAARLLMDPGMRIGLDLGGIGGRMAHAWGTMLNYVRTGAPAYHEYFGLPFWEDLDAHPEVGASFDALIGQIGHGTPDPEFEIEGGWEQVRTVVDVGGGTGGMIVEILNRHPHLRGTLVDLPRAVAQAPAMDRLTTLAQSFFDPLPAGADLYLLRGIINDWPDREAVAILSRCAEAARPNGRVVVLKSVASEGELRGLSIEMVLVGGKHRTVSEFTDLARQAGLHVVGARKQKAYFVVECKPA